MFRLIGIFILSIAFGLCSFAGTPLQQQQPSVAAGTVIKALASAEAHTDCADDDCSMAMNQSADADTETSSSSQVNMYETLDHLHALPNILDLLYPENDQIHCSEYSKPVLSAFVKDLDQPPKRNT